MPPPRAHVGEVLRNAEKVAVPCASQRSVAISDITMRSLVDVTTKQDEMRHLGGRSFEPFHTSEGAKRANAEVAVAPAAGLHH